MMTDGIAAQKQPRAADIDRTLATEAFFEESTRWKYACHGIPPHIIMTMWSHCGGKTFCNLFELLTTKGGGNTMYWCWFLIACTTFYYIL